MTLVLDGSTGVSKVQDGVVTAADVNASFPLGITEIDQWRITTNNANQGTDAIIDAGWERVDDPSFSKLGTGLSVSSGVFTFPSTGLWMVFGHFRVVSQDNDVTTQIITFVSLDSGSTYDNVYTMGGGAGDSGGAATQSIVGNSIVNVSDASTTRLKFETSSFTTNSALSADSNTTRSGVTFIRLGGSQ